MTADIPQVWVAGQVALEATCAELAKAEVIACDTEFVRVRTFYPIAGLLQISDGRQVYLIDPVGIENWDPLARVLGGGPLKVFHAAGEDLELLRRLVGTLPTPFIDTQLAISLLGGDLQSSFQAAVESALSITLGKGETRSDWLARPLSDEQLRYACEDVWYLMPLFRSLEARLRAEDKWEWACEESALAVAQAARDMPPEVYYLNYGNAWRLNAQQLGIFRALCAWRERLVRERDIPRAWILKDAQLFDIARNRPASVSALRQDDTLPHAVVRRYGERIIALVASAEPAPLAPMPLPRSLAPMLKSLKSQVEAQAATLGIHPNRLLNKRMLEEYVRFRLADDEQSATPDWLSQWRGPLLRDAFDKLWNETHGNGT